MKRSNRVRLSATPRKNRKRGDNVCIPDPSTLHRLLASATPRPTASSISKREVAATGPSHSVARAGGELMRLVELSAPTQILGNSVRIEDVVDGVGLSPGQRRVFDMVMTGESFFFTGSAGTGKSHTMKVIVEHLTKDGATGVFVTASTGAAACAIGGCTLHSFAGIGLGKDTVEQLFRKIKKNPPAAARWKSVRILIVDEISMINADLFDKLDALARLMKGKPSVPFGGIQLILCGDFFQLPPVQGSPAFTARCWPSAIKHCIELRGNFRQHKDFEFAQILNYLRFGVMTPRAIEILNQCMIPYESRPEAANKVPEGRTTILYPHRADVDRINQLELDKLTGRTHTYLARDTGDAKLRRQLVNCPAPNELNLKKGALVVMLKNIDFERGLVNGAQGVVVAFDEISPIVRFANGVRTSVRESMWDIKMGRDKATRFQVPLMLAFAISIHKSQGMTLERVQMKLGRVWECGQAYVALSRASTASGLHLLDYSPSGIRADPGVIAFHRKMYYAQLHGGGKALLRHAPKKPRYG